MKRGILILINTVVCAIIISGFLLTITINNQNFNDLVENDIENISKLSASAVYSQIDNSLTKPIMVGQTMANDSFLKGWLTEETENKDNPDKQDEIKRYLDEYQNKYKYDSVFLVSAKTNVYYHYQGINKIINPADKHDVWYYDFLKSALSYDLDVDIDEANNNSLTVFVNCLIKNDNGETIGVVGVGVKMNHLQQLLLNCETQYDLKVSLIDEKGIVQVDSNEKDIEMVNVFDELISPTIKGKILENKDSTEISWYPKDQMKNCIISQYIEDLDWYIVVQKTTLPIKVMLTSQFKQDFIFIILIVIVVLFLSMFIINRYNKLLINTATTDDVTNLPNYKMFNEIYRRNRKKSACEEGAFFMFDIDHFKIINDKYGHLFGNTILFQISALLKQILGNKGFAARFGGDEFVGVIYANSDECKKMIEDFFAKLSTTDTYKELNHITISMGVTWLSPNIKIDALVKEADSAMYQSKINGRHKITYFSKL